MFKQNLAVFILLAVVGVTQISQAQLKPGPPGGKPCSDGLCIGQIALDKKSNFRQVQIVKIQYDDNYILRLMDTGEILRDRTRKFLAIMAGCSNGWCVGYIAYDRNNNYRQVHIIAIQNDGKYVLQFSDNGTIQGDRTATYLSVNPGSNPGSRVIYGAGINYNTSPDTACRQRYGTFGLSVEVRNKIYACTYETCGHPSDWTRVFCQ